MENNNLVRNLMSSEDIDNIVEMVDSFELQDIKLAIGEDALLDVMAIADELEPEDAINLLSSLDKLLNTNRGDLVEYDDTYPNLRVSNVSDIKKDTANLLIDERLHANVITMYTEYPILSNFKLVVDTLKVLNTLYIIESDTEALIAQLNEEGVDLTEYLKDKGVSVTNILNKFDTLEEKYTSDEKVSAYFDDLEDGEPKTVKSLLELIIDL